MNVQTFHTLHMHKLIIKKLLKMNNYCCVIKTIVCFFYSFYKLKDWSKANIIQEKISRENILAYSKKTYMNIYELEEKMNRKEN